MNTGVILAGGRASRLGPLTAGLNKSLVTVGQQPMLIRQVKQLRKLGCETIIVVCTPSSQELLETVIKRVGIRHAVVVPQPVPTGPASAVGISTAYIPGVSEVTILMSDTLLDDDDLPGAEGVCAAPAPSGRRWCYHNGHEFLDFDAPEGRLVSCGAFRFNSCEHLRSAARFVNHDMQFVENGEVGMAPLLNVYEEKSGTPLAEHRVTSWLDVGDPAALAEAQRNRFNARPFNELSLDDRGILRKRTTSTAEINFMVSPPPAARHLFPRVYRAGADWYEADHIDLPSMAELWLYWPSVPEMWGYLTDQLVKQLQLLWATSNGHADIRKRSTMMWFEKLAERYDAVEIDGIEHDEAFTDAMTVGRVTHTMMQAAPQPGILHGDPNMSNVLTSLRTGTFKLLDPRGEWGGPSSLGDIRYDVGKIAYSPELVAVTHGLFDIDGDQVRLWPDRRAETEALERSLSPYAGAAELNVLKAHMLLSSAPLHPEPERKALFLLGRDLFFESA